MKYVLILLILNLNFCLKAKKSPFDVSKPSLGMIGFIFSSLNRTSTTTASTSGDTTPPTVTVTNLKSKGTIETGLLIGTASDNVEVASVEVQINSGSYAAATVTAVTGATTPSVTWKYTLPKGSAGNVLKQVPKNTISVRATNKSGKQTVSSLTEIRKGENKDINGDGYPDFVVGAPNYLSGANTGRVYIFYSSATGPTQTLFSGANQTLDGTASSKFGTHAILSDFNQDGYVDLFICTNETTNTRGYLYNGSATGISSSINLTFIPPLSGAEYCTTNPVVGDFNGDGFPDLAVGDVTGTPGHVYIYNGSSSSIPNTPSTTITSIGSNFGGYSLAAGDVNGDGYTDLASSSSPDASTKDIFIFHGSSAGLANSVSNVTTSISTGGGLSNRLAFGDINNDGYDDLIVGDTTVSTNTGKLYIYFSNGTSLSTTSGFTINGNGTNQHFPASGGTPNYQYAKTIAVADINQDGKNDLIVGNGTATSPSANQGSVFIFYGCSTNTLCASSGGLASSASVVLSGITASDLFGYSISISDVNGDGLPDLLASAKGYSSNKGGLYVFLNKGTGYATSVSAADKIMTGQTVNDNTGASIGMLETFPSKKIYKNNFAFLLK